MDDEAMLRELAAVMLPHLGYSIDTVKDGEEAIRSFCEAKEKGKPYDILIFDLGIPHGMGGEEAIREIRKIDPAARAIISSGSSESPWEGVENIEGYQAVVNKPYTIQEIDLALKQALGK